MTSRCLDIADGNVVVRAAANEARAHERVHAATPLQKGWLVPLPGIHWHADYCAQERQKCNGTKKVRRIGRSANSAFFGSSPCVELFTHALMKTNVLEPKSTRSRACSGSVSVAAERLPCPPRAAGTQRPFCMLCVHCPKCLENPHTVSCDLCAGCRACSMHGRGE